MGGMIQDWNAYNDPLNDISRPAHMAPLWLQAKYTTHAEIDPDIWLEDPPATSLTACMAVKCAELQSAAAGDLMLLYLRKAVMTRKKNIAKKRVVLELAEEMSSLYPIPDIEQFKTDFEQNNALSQLKEDLQITRTNNIGRFPTIVMRKPMQAKGFIITGYRPFEILTKAFNQLNDVLTHQD
jgi:predicted DsbA family dithiol-disulfide isomerase